MEKITSKKTNRALLGTMSGGYSGCSRCSVNTWKWRKNL